MTAAILADFKTVPYFHQLKEFELSSDMKVRALLWQMRTGKTKVIIDTACHLYLQGKIDAVLVIAPNGVHENWIRRELPVHHWDTVDRDTVTWRTSVAGEKGVQYVKAHERKGWQANYDAWWARVKRLLKTDEKLAWFSFNSDTMTRFDVRKVIKNIIKYKTVLVVFDESHDYRAPGSKRTQMARALAKRCEYRRILTGTVVTNSPLHAWSQYELLETTALGFRKYKDFKENFAIYKKKRNMRTGQMYQVLDKYINLEDLRARMAPLSSVVLRDDCNDLPDVIRSKRTVKLNDEQVRLYRELHNQFLLDVDSTEVSVGENTSKIIKFQQIVNGFLIDEFGDVHTIPGPNPRLEILSDEVYLAPGKVIIWCQFHEDMDRVVERLMADGHEVVQYHGRISDDKKAEVREQFAPGAINNVKALVGHPKSGGQGLDLSGASEIIWYSHTFDAIIREQADERATAMGKENIPIIDIVAPGVDEYILENVLNKISIAEALAGQGMKDALRSMKL